MSQQKTNILTSFKSYFYDLENSIRFQDWEVAFETHRDDQGPERLWRGFPVVAACQAPRFPHSTQQQ